MRDINHYWINAHRLLCCLVLTVILGCGTSSKTYPVAGKVFFAGQPAKGAEVVFHEKDAFSDSSGKPVVKGVVNEVGEFQVAAEDGTKGAPVGEYTVTVILPTTISKKHAPKTNYADATQTPLHIEIKAGVNDLRPFNLL